MTINLEDFVDKKVKVTLRDTKIREGIIKYFTNERNRKVFFIRTSNYDLGDFDKEGNNKYDSQFNIIHIKELSMNTQQISEEINKVQAQLESLQVKLKQAEAQEKFNSEFFTPVEEISEYIYCLKFLKTKDVDCITGGFDWANTPQGYAYWNDIAVKNKSLDKSDIQQIKDWVINYMILKENI